MRHGWFVLHRAQDLRQLVRTELAGSTSPVTEGSKTNVGHDQELTTANKPPEPSQEASSDSKQVLMVGTAPSGVGKQLAATSPSCTARASPHGGGDVTPTQSGLGPPSRSRSCASVAIACHWNVPTRILRVRRATGSEQPDMLETTYKSPLHHTVTAYPTDFWNDSCSVEELTYAIEHGAVGATSNPTIVEQVLRQERHLWEDRILELIARNPSWSDEDVMGKVFEEIAVKGAELLLPVFEGEDGMKGRMSIQTNPSLFRNVDKMVSQAVYYDSLAPNMQVKLPATSRGIAAIEEATYRGVNINATVSFTVPQAVAIGEAVERGLERRTEEGLETEQMSPVTTIMVGRTDDWMGVVTKRDGITVNPQYLPWAGVAVFKKASRIYQKRGFRSRLLAAAYRHHLHWSEFIGGDVILTIPSNWQKLFNSSEVEVKDRMDDPVAPEIIEELYDRVPDFAKAYDEDGMTVEEFDTYGATVRTLRGFIASYHELTRVIREDFMLPNPDVK